MAENWAIIIQSALAATGNEGSPWPVKNTTQAIEYLSRVEERRGDLDLTAIRERSVLVQVYLARPWKILQILHSIGIPAQAIVYDIGSGGGCPGIGLKLAGMTNPVVLVERSTKKAKFMEETLRVLELTDVSVRSIDARRLQPSPGDWIISQGVNLGRRPLRPIVDRWVTQGSPLVWITLPRKGMRYRFGGHPPNFIEIPDDPYVLALWE